jgi:hypothetical protein
MAKRMRTKLREIKEQLMATRHDGIDGTRRDVSQESTTRSKADVG